MREILSCFSSAQLYIISLGNLIKPFMILSLASGLSVDFTSSIY